jgi:hypothetical protein
MHTTTQQLEAHVTNALSPRDIRNPQIRDLLTDLADRRALSSLIRTMLADPEQLSRTASESYTHDNGFDKIVILAPEHSGYKLRLHIWWPDHDKPYTENIHDHRWDFASVVLTGSCRNQIFRRAKGGESVHEYRYIRPEQRGSYVLSPVGEAEIYCTLDTSLVAGTYYTMHHTEFHRIVSDRLDLTSTLFLQSPPLQNWTHLFAPQVLVHSGQVQQRSFSTEELAEKLTQYLSHLEDVPIRRSLGAPPT